MKNRRDAARRLRYQRGLCVHCPGKRHGDSSRCLACCAKAAAYQRRTYIRKRQPKGA
jgi:hypothetical protein